jgi:molybdenum cofactor cytidylyltransferase
MYTAILLAAGRSSRMGQPKGLLLWKGKPLILHQLQQIASSKIKDIIVVLGHQPEAYKPYINDKQATVLWNQNWEQGKSSSILKGLSAIKRACRAILFVNIDQPVSYCTINQLIDAHKASKAWIYIPVFNGRRGHPVLFSTHLLPALHAITEETQGLKQIIRNYAESIVHVTMDEDSILYNFNTLFDYEEGRKK